jgi:hypothetical protein
MKLRGYETWQPALKTLLVWRWQRVVKAVFVFRIWSSRFLPDIGRRNVLVVEPLRRVLPFHWIPLPLSNDPGRASRLGRLLVVACLMLLFRRFILEVVLPLAALIR